MAWAIAASESANAALWVLVVISEKYHPGWRASVDGNAEAVVQANGDFMGCLVEAGEHEVSLRFDPASLRWGRWVSLAGAMVFAGWLAVMRKKRT